MKKLLWILCIFIVLLPACTSKLEKVPAIKLEIKDGWYYINGQKTFINALGYEIGARPGQHPKEPRKSELERMKNDFTVIKKAGFNAIRTWDVLYKEELELAQQMGVMVIFGIEVNSWGDFADKKFIEKAIHQVDTALSYSKDFDCIISYLIMNEPMPEHINKTGAQATLNLWRKLIDLVHEKHPGIPVSISANSAIADWLNMNIFDIYSYNAYDYAEGFNDIVGFSNANRFLKDMNGQNKPLVLTEFGLSVSKKGFGKYGSNTIEEQMVALPVYYRNILDAGASGACPFYYADGWWKGGEPSVHNDTPEEWFGYWGYSDLNDTIGHPRPVWYALTTYNKALIASPKNQTFYKNLVPIEIFLQNNVAKINVVYLDKVIYEISVSKGGYFTDTISFAGENLIDRELVFEFYDRQGEIVKYETIIVLTGKDQISWPELKINTIAKDLNASKTLSAELLLKNDTIFTLSNNVRYIFQHHIGWNPGTSEQATIDRNKKEQTLKISYEVPEESLVVGIYAGTDVQFGKFTKTIFDYKFIYRGTWADPLKIED